jgi:hypothetical protein
VDNFQRLSPALDSGEDGVSGFGPDEWIGLVVAVGDEAVDGGLKLEDRGEDAALEPLPGKLSKSTFDRVGPGTRSRGEVEGEAQMTCEPTARLGVLVGNIVVADHIDHLVGRHFALDGIEKADEFWCRWRCMQRPMIDCSESDLPG